MANIRLCKTEIAYALEQIERIESILRKGVSPDTEKHLKGELEIYYRNHARFRQWLEEEIASKKKVKEAQK